jgi:hypothetical protein
MIHVYIHGVDSLRVILLRVVWYCFQDSPCMPPASLKTLHTAIGRHSSILFAYVDGDRLSYRDYGVLRVAA